tara:strand:+ start:2941 stop:3237 length:297 start_codon:yes stop_codon:yes gene_type:complete
MNITHQEEETRGEIEWQRALDKRYAEAKALAAFVKTIELPDCIAIGEINAEDEYAVHHTTLQHLIVWAKTERGIKAGITRVMNRAAKHQQRLIRINDN